MRCARCGSTEHKEGYAREGQSTYRCMAGGCFHRWRAAEPTLTIALTALSLTLGDNVTAPNGKSYRVEGFNPLKKTIRLSRNGEYATIDGLTLSDGWEKAPVKDCKTCDGIGETQTAYPGGGHSDPDPCVDCGGNGICDGIRDGSCPDGEPGPAWDADGKPLSGEGPAVHYRQKGYDPCNCEEVGAGSFCYWAESDSLYKSAGSGWVDCIDSDSGLTRRAYAWGRAEAERRKRTRNIVVNDEQSERVHVIQEHVDKWNGYMNSLRPRGGY